MVNDNATGESRTERFTELLREMRDLNIKKSQDYGDGEDPYENIRDTRRWGIPAWMGAMIRAADKVKRLQSFARNGSLANEGVEDNLRDIAVYAVIALIMWEEERDASSNTESSKSAPVQQAE